MTWILLCTHLPEECQITLPCLSQVVMWAPWSIKGIDDKITGQATEKLDNTNTNNSLSVELLQTALNVLCTPSGSQLFAQHVRVF
jgi:hypothetical protein